MHWGGQGTVEDMHIYMKNLLATREKLNELYAVHTGQTVEKLAEAMDRDYFLTPHEAVKFGLVDEVIDRRPPPEPLLPPLS
jgi:ATP-dependent Clp protease protease subunit